MTNNIINIVEQITEKKCFDTYRRCLDHERASLIEYDSFSHDFMKEQGETTKFKGPRNIKEIADEWKKTSPAFSLFMDGSRRTYKIADMPIGTQVFPVVAGQVGVAVCKREKGLVLPCRLKLQNVLTFPDKMDSDGKNDKQHTAFFANIKDKINSFPEKRINIDAVLFYKTKAEENFEDKAIARIQDFMIEEEKNMVANLVQDKVISDRTWLIKDGSLEYSRTNEDDNIAIARIKTNYKRVVGVSKSFNPELAKLKNDRSAARLIADLKPFERTPATMYQTPRVGGRFAIWYVRLREARKSRGPFDGIVKVEKYLVNDKEVEFGLSSTEVDNISAWLMNERNPVCYGKDDRWANHLYPIYLTENYIKSKYMSTAHFINLF